VIADTTTNIAGSRPRRPKFRDSSAPDRDGVAPRYRLRKRALDLVVCLTALPIIAPVLLLCASLIKLTSPGPLFFVQHRTGAGGRRFKMYKFRTMVPGAADMKEEILDANIMGGPDFKVLDDPRVTPIGVLLRKTSLDETPQIWNIIKGDMSLVGPRPTSFDSSTYDLWHTERLEVPPGLTGLWQVSGRGEIDFDDRVRLDITYVRNRSMRLDMTILLQTIPAVLSQRGAY
jgi:lipopolysaccharide/colanic/teichoic acid biosynthesis glycosyltransferase